ncbi:MAG: hypothetical protein J6C81_04000 [Muribaculaceae bacterium]|nr:hypothetical protein [Muribaculaceae bacterium]
MTKLKIFLTSILLFLLSIPAVAQAIPSDSIPSPDSLFPEASKPLFISRFTWGAEIGASVDMTGNNLSTFDIDAFFGYKNSWIRTLGVGAGIHRAFGNSNMFIPVYAMFRSSFRSKPSLLFLNAKVGYSFNTLEDTNAKGGIKTNLGLGINLAMSRRFKSHIIIGCEYFHLDTRQSPSTGLSIQDIFFGNISFGVNF